MPAAFWGAVAAVELQGVWKAYDRVRHVLQDASLLVDSGTLVVLMGRSGSGKTTLLNLVAGLDRPSRGRVLLEGTDVNALDEHARTDLRLRRIGIVFQKFHLIPELTVDENVRLPMTLARRSDAAQRTGRLLAFFGLASQQDAFPATLSGGEAQRAALARALANEPAVVLADEPTANLDDENAENALAALRRVAQELGTAVLVASHDPQVREIGDRVLELRGGRLVEASGALSRPRAPGAARGPGPSPGSST